MTRRIDANVSDTLANVEVAASLPSSFHPPLLISLPPFFLPSAPSHHPSSMKVVVQCAYAGLCEP
jgi:hypothetical protein